MIPNDFATIQLLEEEGYFERARRGDQRAASLFARLAAYRLNPGGDPGGWGWLTKSSGEQQVDGYAEDAMVYTNDASNLNNVVDLVAGAGAPGARISWNGPKARRPNNRWEAPKALSAADLAYLKGAPGSVPTPAPPAPPKPAYPGDQVWHRIGELLEADMKARGRGLDSQSGVWWGRTIWRHVAEGMPLEQSIAKSQQEWRAILGGSWP